MLDRKKPSGAGKRGPAESWRPLARWKLSLATAVLGCGLSGCAGFWDDVTSRDFAFKKMFVRPEPLEVLKDSHDGDERAKALRALRRDRVLVHASGRPAARQGQDAGSRAKGAKVRQIFR